MSRFLLALRCFFAVLFYYRLPKEALALLPTAPPTEDTGREGPSREQARAAAPGLPERGPGTPPTAAAEEAAPTREPPAAPERPREAAPAAPVAAPAAPAPAEVAPALSPTEAMALRHRGAVQLLAVLQREGRLVDFLMEEVDGYGDAQIGAAARDIHRGCRKGLLEHISVAPVRPEPDEAAVRVEEGYDPSAVRLIGNIQGRPPFHGTLRHHGWRALEVRLPDLPPSHDPLVITPAEVELGG